MHSNWCSISSMCYILFIGSNKLHCSRLVLLLCCPLAYLNPKNQEFNMFWKTLVKIDLVSMKNLVYFAVVTTFYYSHRELRKFCERRHTWGKHKEDYNVCVYFFTVGKELWYFASTFGIFRNTFWSIPVVFNLFCSIAPYRNFASKSPPTYDFSVGKNIVITWKYLNANEMKGQCS